MEPLKEEICGEQNVSAERANPNEDPDRDQLKRSFDTCSFEKKSLLGNFCSNGGKFLSQSRLAASSDRQIEK